MRGQIFISYRRATDAWAVDKLRDELVGAFGEKNVFLDRDTIASGDDWDQRIDEAVRSAAAVVVVFSAQWYGQPKLPAAGAEAAAATPPADAATARRPPEPGHRPRRIDDPTDKLRRELEMALKHRCPIFPIIVDDSPEPRAEELPDSVRAVVKHQFLRIDVNGNTEAQMARLIGDIRRATAGHDWLVRLSGQAAWLGLLALSMVLAAHQVSWGGLEIFRNAFARGAMALRDRLALEAPSVAVVEMGEPEYRELFGGRAPLELPVACF